MSRPDNSSDHRGLCLRAWTNGGWHRLAGTFVIGLLVLGGLSACGFGGDDNDNETGQVIEWQQGTPPGELTVADQTQPTQAPAQPTEIVQAPPSATTAPQPTAASTAPVLAAGESLSPEQLAELQPNELGFVPVLMYHNIVTEWPEEADPNDVLYRSVEDFLTDLQWLYDRNFYVVPFRDYLTDQISAPAGKKPVVLTFDDSRPSQLFYLFGADGSVSIDPNSAIGLLEGFFASHPDFGHTAFFSILPIHCFDYEQPDQEPYCQQKLQWLVDNGYEIGNHTYDHQDLSDVPNDVFIDKIGSATDFLQEMAPATDTANVLVLPYGNFPQGTNSDQQWDWIRNGFTWNGEDLQLLSVVAAGANPAPSPVSLDFDIMSIARIGAKNGPAAGESDLFLDYWFSEFENRPDLLYVSDGNPDTITLPEALPDALAGLLDEEKTAADGKTVVRY